MNGSLHVHTNLHRDLTIQYVLPASKSSPRIWNVAGAKIKKTRQERMERGRTEEVQVCNERGGFERKGCWHQKKEIFLSMRSLTLVYSYLEDLKGNQRFLFSNSAVAMRA